MSKCPADLECYSAMLRALGSPHRLQIYLRLVQSCGPDGIRHDGQEECPCVGEFARALSLAPSTVSHHIRQLCQAGLICTERDGKLIRCWASPEALDALSRLFRTCAAECPGLLLSQGLSAGPHAQNASVIEEACMPDLRSDEATADRVRSTVRARYAAHIQETTGGCACGRATEPSGCCGHGADAEARSGRPVCCGESRDVACGCGREGGYAQSGGSDCCGHHEDAPAVGRGYTPAELASLPEGAAVSFGCGNPGALAGLRPGETVLDLGSGGGLDCLLAARGVGPTGHVIGVDMTPEMIERSRANARAAGCANVEFRLGEIEHLPVADATVDVIISNCVINLSPDKPAVFAEAYRVLRPGGRLIVSDVVSMAPMPADLRSDDELWCACVSGAEGADALEAMLEKAGFRDVLVTPDECSRATVADWSGSKAAPDVLTAVIEAWKPE